ncbi:probable signal recognition particle protein [Aeropyrum pernix K1]|uniref:Signal recognition particle receptor FtsY n=1 Tax=Aeropyrum pernix (strain ATCC 700893 / DSM 11879 / JCM 9820 / NBRC 100138 / K1) TaxID=272557 RepID=Q9YD31_AERPE|nr:signal recognition particle-docking protein FtsY [Aeropyrum pernix]BAA80066.2 probable signal recognition particle protein [Aeropyrum pernix K1]
MFGRLREALNRASEHIARGIVDTLAYKELKPEDLEPVLDDILIDLVESDVALEAAESIVAGVKEGLTGYRVRRGEPVEKVVRDALRKALLTLLDPGPRPDLAAEARRRCGGRPLVILFLGVNGTGKTTTIAKVAYMLRKAGVTPVIAAADTFRAGAQEQLAVHAEKLGVPIVRGRYGGDPASVAYDAVKHAESRGFCAVLVDTAGRMHVDSNLVEELRKIVRVVKPDYKILVVDSLTGNDAVEQARLFDEAVGVDGVIVTKVDADPKGGTLVSVAHAIRKPILYIGTGQRYEDLRPFDPQKIVDQLLG